jgi:hypothetical protein
MSIEQVIHKYHSSRLGDSIGPVSQALAKQLVLVATDNVATTRSTTLRLKTAEDNQGRTWAYAYTSEAEFLKALPPGSAFAELRFPDLFDIVNRDARFAGIFLNSASDISYPIPREVFLEVKQALQGPVGQ